METVLHDTSGILDHRIFSFTDTVIEDVSAWCALDWIHAELVVLAIKAGHGGALQTFRYRAWLQHTRDIPYWSINYTTVVLCRRRVSGQCEQLWVIADNKCTDYSSRSFDQHQVVMSSVCEQYNMPVATFHTPDRALRELSLSSDGIMFVNRMTNERLLWHIPNNVQCYFWYHNSTLYDRNMLPIQASYIELDDAFVFPANANSTVMVHCHLSGTMKIVVNRVMPHGDFLVNTTTDLIEYRQQALFQPTDLLVYLAQSYLHFYGQTIRSHFERHLPPNALEFIVLSIDTVPYEHPDYSIATWRFEFLGSEEEFILTLSTNYDDNNAQTKMILPYALFTPREFKRSVTQLLYRFCQFRQMSRSKVEYVNELRAGKISAPEIVRLNREVTTLSSRVAVHSEFIEKAAAEQANASTQDNTQVSTNSEAIGVLRQDIAQVQNTLRVFESRLGEQNDALAAITRQVHELPNATAPDTATDSTVVAADEILKKLEATPIASAPTATDGKVTKRPRKPRAKKPTTKATTMPITPPTEPAPVSAPAATPVSAPVATPDPAPVATPDPSQ